MEEEGLVPSYLLVAGFLPSLSASRWPLLTLPLECTGLFQQNVELSFQLL